MDVVDTSTSTNNSKARGIGSRLKQAREAKGLSIDAVASELYILKRHLEAIERDDYDSLPQAAFTRGFVLSYAKHLKLDIDSVLTDFDATYPKEQASTEKPLAESIQTQQIARVSRDQRTQKTSFGRFGLLFAFLGLVGIMAAFYYNSGTKSTADTGSVVADGKVSALDNIRQEQGDVQVGSENAPQVNADSTSTASNGTTETVKADVTKTDATAIPAVIDPNASESTLDFWVHGKANITVKDQSGAVLFSGTKQYAPIAVTGKPPLHVSISRVNAVSLDFDKEKVFLGQYRQQDGSASFTLTK